MAKLTALLFVLSLYILETNAVCGICNNIGTSAAPTIACITDIQYAICNAGDDDAPDTAAMNCPSGQYCSSTGTAASPCVVSTTNPSGCVLGTGIASLCPSTGRYPVVNTVCKNYRLCTTFSNGTMTYYTYTCPNTSVFDPVSRTCSITYVCPP